MVGHRTHVVPLSPASPVQEWIHFAVVQRAVLLKAAVPILLANAEARQDRLPEICLAIKMLMSKSLLEGCFPKTIHGFGLPAQGRIIEASVAFVNLLPTRVWPWARPVQLIDVIILLLSDQITQTDTCTERITQEHIVGVRKHDVKAKLHYIQHAGQRIKRHDVECFGSKLHRHCTCLATCLQSSCGIQLCVGLRVQGDGNPVQTKSFCIALPIRQEVEVGKVCCCQQNHFFEFNMGRLIPV
mmetsp:Transcript_27516/g.64136  ORF Transcript_27516/g.64136 Transcript_27516/m.64136 type:complete len:242 (-) Transcript_27516:313-1038(-)